MTGATALPVAQVDRSRLPTIDFDDLPFGTVFSDHMLVAEHREGAWRNARLQPYGPLALPPSISALQYGVSVFEGLKAHRSAASELLLFRPGENARRLNRSAARLAMPLVPEALFLDGLRGLLRLDEAWVPPSGKGALYIRPCLFSVDPSIRVKPADEFVFVIFTCPVGPYFAAPVDALVTERYVRAFPGGTGEVKPAGNYAAAMLADQDARSQGYQSTMWLDGVEHRYIEECGVMNVFFVIGEEVVTPELGGTILPGVTRDSVITLLRAAGTRVSERRISVDEVFDAHAQGTLRECFGTGTAATVAHVRRMRQGTREILLPPVEERSVGPGVLQQLRALTLGALPDPFGWVERV
jgi:branched-chain amino acid aminotransferase